MPELCCVGTLWAKRFAAPPSQCFADACLLDGHQREATKGTVALDDERLAVEAAQKKVQEVQEVRGCFAPACRPWGKPRRDFAAPEVGAALEGQRHGSKGRHSPTFSHDFRHFAGRFLGVWGWVEVRELAERQQELVLSLEERVVAPGVLENVGPISAWQLHQ